MHRTIILIENIPTREYQIAKEMLQQRGGAVALLWSGYEENRQISSLLKQVEANGDSLRKQYAAWIHDLGTIGSERSSLISRLTLPDKFSFWWTTLLAEQSNVKQPSLTSVLKFFLIEKILHSKLPQQLVYVGSNMTHVTMLKQLCHVIGISFCQEYVGKIDRRLFHRQNILLLIKGVVVALIFAMRCYRIARRHIYRETTEGKNVLICSYLDNIDVRALEKGYYKSNYWNEIPELFRSEECHLTILHFFVPSPRLPNLRSAAVALEKFNRNGDIIHRLNESGFRWPMLFRSVRCMIKWYLTYSSIEKAVKSIRPVGSALEPWLLVKHDMQRSLYGSDAGLNLLYRELFDVTFKSIPTQQTGIYLCENQGWERSFAFAWKKYHHGRLFGAVHTTMRYWDLRYFVDMRSRDLQPREDLLLYNGLAALEQHQCFYSDVRGVAIVEALRYQYLFQLSTLSQQITGEGVLILGDYIPSATDRLLEMAAKAINGEKRVIVKPHPNYKPSSTLLVKLDAIERNEPLTTLFHEVRIAICGASTSASVDAYIAGLQVIVVMEENELNMSPLRSTPDVAFVTNVSELKIALQTPPPVTGRMEERRSRFFCWTDGCPEWRKLILS